MHHKNRSASVILSDDPEPSKLECALAEIKRERDNAYDRVEQLEHVVRGVIFMVSKLSPEQRQLICTHPAIIDAHEVLL